MKRAIIVHCWGGNPQYAWYPWAKVQLEEKGYKVSVPEMLESNRPQLNKWLPYLMEVVGIPDEELVLIGHSIGTVAILRYLEELEEGERINKAILVAGFTDQLGFKELENFFTKPLDYRKIAKKCANGFVAIQSDNDPFVAAQYGVRLHDEIGAKLVIKLGAYHMSGPSDSETACLKLPEVLDQID